MMQSLSACDLLTVWEQGYGRTTAEKALLFLRSTWPEVPAAELAAWSVGQRDGRLLALREQLFGPTLNSVVDCSHCGERLELSFRTADVLVDGAADPASELSISVTGYEVRFRPPNAGDLLAIDLNVGLHRGETQLLQRCLIEVKHNDEVQSADQLPDEVVTAIARRMATADPQADVHLDLACPACEHEWRVAFDVVAFLWEELNAWAIRVLRDVHDLARAYGWCEGDILKVSPWRRQLYLQMVNG